MQIADLLPPCSILLGAAAADKAQAIHLLTGLMDTGGHLADAAAFEQDVLAREAQGTTGVGGGIAIPHAKSAAVRSPGLAALTLRDGIDYQSITGEPVRLMFLIAVPQDASDLHVKILAHLAQMLMDPTFCQTLLEAATPQEFLARISRCEAADVQREAARRPAAPPAKAPVYRLLAVTACPTGIAHTYMAAEALAERAGQMGISIKVETDGASGVGNPLTPEEIAAAECIIVAADRTVNTARFAGKPVLMVPVINAVAHPGDLLRQATSGQVPVLGAFRQDIPRGQQAATGRANLFYGKLHHLYAHVMSGVTHMLPFVTGGGVLIALSYLLDRTNAGSLGFGDGTTLARLLGELGHLAFDMMYPALAAAIAFSIGELPALVPGLVGGLMARSGMTAGPESSWVASGFWGALVAGFAAGGLIRLLRRATRKMPESFEQTKTTLVFPVVGLLGIGILMLVVVNPPLGQFNEWLYQLLNGMRSGSRILLCGVLGALMAVDFGGPVNKAAYLFATVAMAGGQNGFMASCMVAGMTPSIGVALACSLFKNRFTLKERRTALTNYFLGFSFVTEGALPFALRDPLRVSPACIAGSALAGMLSALMGCTCPAPHGGLFLLPLMGNPPGFLLALGLGSALTCALLGLLKKPLPEE